MEHVKIEKRDNNNDYYKSYGMLFNKTVVHVVAGAVGLAAVATLYYIKDLEEHTVKYLSEYPVFVGRTSVLGGMACIAGIFYLAGFAIAKTLPRELSIKVVHASIIIALLQPLLDIASFIAIILKPLPDDFYKNNDHIGRQYPQEMPLFFRVLVGFGWASRATAIMIVAILYRMVCLEHPDDFAGRKTRIL